MNKARLILTAIGIFAVVGGALALKANTLIEKNVYCTTSGSCLTTSYRTLVNAQPTTQPCIGTTVYFTSPLCNVPTTGTVYFTSAD